MRHPHPVRVARIEDAAEIARLLTQLGHETTAADVTRAWSTFTGAGDVALVAPNEGGGLAGLATLHTMRVLHRPRPVGRVTALVVDAPARGRGLGRALMVAAEERLRRAGCGLVEITSHVRRAEAHAFYEHLGYERTSVRLARTFPFVDDVEPSGRERGGAR